MYKVYTYKGFKIYHNFSGSRFTTDFWTIVNSKLTDKNGKKWHVHATSKTLAKKIVDCFHTLSKYGYASGYQRNIRNKACRLMGIYIKSR